MSVKIEKDNSLVISDFSKGIGQSVLSEYTDMMGVNITNNPGLVSAGFQFNKVSKTMPSLTFTADANTNILTLSDSADFRGNYNAMAFTVSTTGTLPAGLSADTIYFAAELSSTTMKVCTTLKNLNKSTYVDITSAGNGIHTINWITPKEITGWTKNSQGRIFAIDSNQRVWFGSDNGVTEQWLLITGNTSFGYGSGIIFYKGYIIVFGNGNCDALTDIQDPFNNDSVWENGFATVTIKTQGHAIPHLSVNDDAIYFYNGSSYDRYYGIGMLEEVAGKIFSPSDTSTFTFVQYVLKIPYEENGTISVIAELNEYLLVGTCFDKIYFWDKKSPSFTSFLRLPEVDIQGIQVVGNMAYAIMRNSGTIYQINTISFGVLLKLPENITHSYPPNIVVNCSTVYNRELLFAISADFRGTYPNETVSNYLMSYNLDTGQLIRRNISSYGETTERSGSFYGKIYSIMVDGDNVFIGSSSYSIAGEKYDYAIESLLFQPYLGYGYANYFVYSNYEPYIITGLIGIGDIYNKKTFRELQLSLTRNLINNQGVGIYYRKDDNSSWTLLKTIDYTTCGGIKDIKIPAPVSDVIDLQLKITIKGVNQSSPIIKFIRLIP